MATNLPFTPTTGATVGNTVAVTANNTPTSVSGTITCTTAQANNIRVYNSGTVFVRMTREASPTATAADVPVGPGQAIVLMNPNPEGVTGVAVLSSAASTAIVYFTPGEGGA